jgi:hypothetical protein
MIFSSLPNPDDLSIRPMPRGFCPEFNVLMTVHIYVMSKFGIDGDVRTTPHTPALSSTRIGLNFYLVEKITFQLILA